MTTPEIRQPKEEICDESYIKNGLKLARDNSSSTLILRLSQEGCARHAHTEGIEAGKFSTYEGYLTFFRDVEIIRPEAMCRPSGETTLFTTAGIQRIESLLRGGQEFEKVSYVVAQPVIRSQFMDRARDGTSSSFVNLSVIDIRSTPKEFILRCDELIDLVVSHGAGPEDLRFTIVTDEVTWGQKKFHNISLTLHYHEVELGECVYIYDYPLDGHERISIIDLGFSTERLQWGIRPNRNYFPDFDLIYESLSNVDSSSVTAIIDAVRSMVLIAGEGIVPSNNNHGYRLRQFSKRYIARTLGVHINDKELVRIAYEAWQRTGHQFSASLEETEAIITRENQRNFNAAFLAKVTSSGLGKIYVDINQSTDSFLKQVRFSIPEEKIKNILNQMI
ncbi:MAG: hypothetical protein HXY38_16185 [Chloroflexi bacterium]|nr:hypothetical protein [Chloroflexota bacterium]